LALYRTWLGQGHRLRATAGTDIHGPEGGMGRLGFNHVQANDLTEAAILAAVAAGRNYLSSGPKLVLTAELPDGGVVAMGGEARAGAAVLVDWATGDEGLDLVIHDARGEVFRQSVAAGASGQLAPGVVPQGYVMAELRGQDGVLHAVTNPIFMI
jgi:hypothetical protein